MCGKLDNIDRLRKKIRQFKEKIKREMKEMYSELRNKFLKTINDAIINFPHNLHKKFLILLIGTPFECREHIQNT